MSVDLLSELVAKTHAVSDRKRQEFHIACPECGHESSPKSPHFSFSRRGYHCFVCGASGSLNALAGLLSVEVVNTGARTYTATKAAPRAAQWLTGALAERFAEHPRRNELWQAYKPVSVATLDRQKLGVGVLPYSKCKHDRLIVPVFAGPQLVGLRGRQIDCDCGKWLASAGWSNELAPLYNSDSLRIGQVVWIVENPVDALMLAERTEYIGVATYSVSYWTEAWTNRLQEAQPELVIVAYDNDLVGCGGANRRAEFEREWLKTHPVLPPSGGVKVVNRLLEAGLPATLFDWGDAPHKSDIGNLLMQEAVV